MSDTDLQRLERTQGVAKWRRKLARFMESLPVQHLVTAVILTNAAVLGIEASPSLAAEWSGSLQQVAEACLTFFVVELLLRLAAYQGLYWRSGWNWFDLAVVGMAVVPSSGPWTVLRALRVLRLFTVVPQMRKVATAFLRSIPGISSVVALKFVFFYTAGVLATGLFAGSHPDWFGSLGKSLYTLFQIMTLESWSMGIVRPVMEVHPWAWAFFVPFIVIATFTILNLFVGIIVSTMQELATKPDAEVFEPDVSEPDVMAVLDRMEEDLKQLRARLDRPVA